MPLRTFQSSGTAASSLSDADNRKTPSALNAGRSRASLGSTGGGASGSNPLDAAQGGEEEPPRSAAGGDESKEGERESEVDGGNDEDEDGLVAGEPLECPSDRTQSDEEELWMGPWNRLHIPMTKL